MFPEIAHTIEVSWRNTEIPQNDCPIYDTKLSDGEAPVLDLWVFWSISSLPLLPCIFWPGVVTPDRVLPMDQLEVFDM